MSLESWCTAMESSAESRITLANLIHDVEKGRAHRDTLRRILRHVLELWDEATHNDTMPRDHRTAAALLSATLDQASEEVFCTEPYFAVAGELARVVEIEVLTECYILKGAYGELVKPHSRFKRPAVRKFAASQLQEGAMVRGGRPMAWVTKASALEEREQELEYETRVQEIATRIRNYVGLDHIGDGMEIVEMRYPPGAISACRISAPTVVEGSCRDVYRSYFGEDGDPWGRTIDLESKNLCGGAPEAVHPPIPLTHEFTYRHLGEVRGTRRRLAEDLERKCVRRWTHADIAILLKYIQE